MDAADEFRPAPRTGLVLALGGALLLGGCATLSSASGSNGDGDIAVWDLTHSAGVESEDRVLVVGVTRLDCASGFTGEPLPPQVVYEDDRVVVTIDVEPLTGDAHTCQSNPVEPATVMLDESLGERDLVDGACLEGDAAGTSHCEDPVRWTP
ncbi:hypothetical protein IM660_09635 [Ruania alkalisoli]|uniref:Uncharacterized protein n=1 Tax=Ruania alkalisoli TaxID=2779775 RepID=A0A7M1SZR4_9MICO|nr:hypothetical protein [Ruania alkalisoli]QOR72454.1 hypothetical protein IM660_09635 [Ruania alkalisoli]